MQRWFCDGIFYHILALLGGGIKGTSPDFIWGHTTKASEIYLFLAKNFRKCVPKCLKKGTWPYTNFWGWSNGLFICSFYQNCQIKIVKINIPPNGISPIPKYAICPWFALIPCLSFVFLNTFFKSWIQCFHIIFSALVFK